MATVKGSKEYHWKVVRYNPYLRVSISICFIVAIAVSTLVSYQVGRKQGGLGQEQAFMEKETARSDLELVVLSETKLAQELENIKLGSEIDRKSLEGVRLKVLELQTTIAALEEDNQFYRNLMAPSGNKRGLNFGSVEILATEQPRTYAFKVVLQQLATNHQLLKGSLSFNIIGRKNGEITVLSLNDVSNNIKSVNIKLRFKYFQNIEGELVLPMGFEPERIELDARSTGKNATTVEKRFAWLAEER